MIFLVYNKNFKKFILLILISLNIYLIIDILCLSKIKNKRSIIVYNNKYGCNILFIDGFNVYLNSRNIINEKDILNKFYKGLKANRVNVIIFNGEGVIKTNFLYKIDNKNNIEYFSFYGRNGIVFKGNILHNFSSKNLKWIILDIKPTTRIFKIFEKNIKNNLQIIVNGFRNNRMIKDYQKNYHFIGNDGFYQEFLE